MSDEIPPWQPIADWLCRLGDESHDQAFDRLEYHETEAKAIAYDIATYQKNHD